MKGCWSPWYYYDNIKSGSYAVAATTIFFSSFCIVYVSYCLNGGDSSQFFLPLFETDVGHSPKTLKDFLKMSSKKLYKPCTKAMKYAGGFLLIFYIVFIINSILMIKGISMFHRGLILPWLTQNILYILMIIAYAIWLQASYYHFLLSVLWFIIWLLFAAVHIYMHRCVKTQYNVIKDMYAPNIVLLEDSLYY